MLKSGMKSSDLPIKVWRGAKIPRDVRRAINKENLLNLGGVYGDRNVGIPVEYDHLKIILTDDIVGIKFFNRGITLFVTDDEKAKSIHRLLCRLM